MTDETKKKRLNRRSFMATVLGGAAATGATGLIAGEAQAQQRPTGRTDSDSGSYADRANYGRTGMTDSDPYDRSGYGIGSGGGGGGGGGRSGLTDSDPVDRGGNGRGDLNGFTDSDSGDRAGRGYSGITDSDSGSNRDRAGHGRGRPRG